MGNFREKPNLEKHTVYVKKQAISYAATSMCGWRQYMEDAHIAQLSLLDDQSLSVFGVFDGHGGPQIAKFAQSHFAKCLVENGYFLTKNYQKALTQVFLHMDAMMLAKAGHHQLKIIRDAHVEANNANLFEGQCLAGSTANVVLLTKQYIYCANAGDSRSIAILRDSKVGKPKYKQLSYDHKPDEESERKRIIKAGGTVADGRVNNNLNLSRSLGDFSYKNNKNFNPQQQIITSFPDIIKIPRKQVSLILIGCDGIWQTKSPEKMTKWLHKKMETLNGNLGKVLQALLDEEVSQSPDAELGMDNMSAILVNILR